MSYGMSLATLLKTISRTGLESEVFTLTGRTDLWRAALEMIAERPLFGWGFNSTEEHFSLLFNQDFFGTAVNPHQMLLHLAMGTGLIGAFLALSLFAFRIKNLFERPNTLDDLLTLFILIYGLTEVDLFGTPLFTSLIFFRVALQDGAIRSRS
jgi:exopolysaccharide production protein ExoQ